MKKFFILGIVTAMTLSLVSCGLNNNDEQVLEDLQTSYSEDGIIYNEDSNKNVIDEFSNKLPAVLELAEQTGMNVGEFIVNDIPTEVSELIGITHYQSISTRKDLSFLEYKLDLDTDISYAKGFLFIAGFSVDTDVLYAEGFDIRNLEVYKFLNVFLSDMDSFAEHINNFILGTYDGLIDSNVFTAECGDYFLTVVTSGDNVQCQIKYK